MLLLLAPFAGCQSRTPVELVFPTPIDQWRLTSSQLVRDPPLALGARRVHQAAYEKEGRIVVHAYEFPSEIVAFEAMQKFRQGEKLAFYKGPRFFTVESPEVDRSVLSSFAAELQQAIR